MLHIYLLVHSRVRWRVLTCLLTSITHQGWYPQLVIRCYNSVGSQLQGAQSPLLVEVYLAKFSLFRLNNIMPLEQAEEVPVPDFKSANGNKGQIMEGQIMEEPISYSREILMAFIPCAQQTQREMAILTWVRTANYNRDRTPKMRCIYLL